MVLCLLQFPQCRGFLKRRVKEFVSHYYLKGTGDDNGEEDEATIINTESLHYTPLNIQLGKLCCVSGLNLKLKVFCSVHELVELVFVNFHYSYKF